MPLLIEARLTAFVIARARSTLSRILKNLSAAIHNLVHTSASQRLDYESLMALSNSSRLDAIHAIDRLSYRLASSSRSSVASSASKESSSSRRRHHRSSSSTISPQQSEGRLRKTLHETPGEEKSRNRQKLSKEEHRSSSSPSSGHRGHSRKTSGASRSPVQNRLSLATMSSGSTRLGEVPEGKRRLRYTTTDSSSEEYNVTPVYPLRPYYSVQPEVKEKSFWSMFRRRTGE